MSTQENIKLIVVESYASDSKYRINEIVENITSVSTDEIYWQKEQLLNIGIKQLIDEKLEYIAWVDTDISFLDDAWVERSIKNIKKYKIAQLFNVAFRESASGIRAKRVPALTSFIKKTHANPGVIFKRWGAPGYGFGYHTSCFSKSLLYDKAIVGSGDYLNLIGALHTSASKPELEKDRFFIKANPKFLNHYLDWVDSNGLNLSSIGTCNNSIGVKYHGETNKRQWLTRDSILSSCKFNPDNDLIDLKNGTYALKNRNLAESIKNYFHSRGDDDFLKNPKHYKRFISKITSLISLYDPGYDMSLNPLENLHKFNKY